MSVKSMSYYGSTIYSLFKNYLLFANVQFLLSQGEKK